MGVKSPASPAAQYLKEPQTQRPVSCRRARLPKRVTPDATDRAPSLTLASCVLRIDLSKTSSTGCLCPADETEAFVNVQTSSTQFYFRGASMTAVEPSRAKRLHAVIAVIVLCFLHLTWVAGQERTGTFSTDVIHQLPPAPSLLDENCVVAILNRTTTVNHDGTWILPSVPAGFGLVRARATCVRNGITRFGQSDLFTIAPNQSITLPRIALGNVSPIPRSIGITASTTTLNQSGQAVQLTVTATFSDGSTQNITASSNGTQYRSSNSAVASVNANGLVTAVGSGTAIIQALDEGAQGIISIQVALSIDSDGDGIPDDAELRLGLNPHDPTDALLDLDHDGLTNLQEFQNGSDINNPDSDGDGLTDGQEVLVYHTNPTLVDSDGDGIPDGIEVQTGSDPKNPSSFNLGAA